MGEGMKELTSSICAPNASLQSLSKPNHSWSGSSWVLGNCRLLRCIQGELFAEGTSWRIRLTSTVSISFSHCLNPRAVLILSIWRSSTRRTTSSWKATVLSVLGRPGTHSSKVYSGNGSTLNAAWTFRTARILATEGDFDITEVVCVDVWLPRA